MSVPKLVEERVAVTSGPEIANKLPQNNGKVDSTDANIIFYVTEAIIRSELGMRKCKLCKELLNEVIE